MAHTGTLPAEPGLFLTVHPAQKTPGRVLPIKTQRQRHGSSVPPRRRSFHWSLCRVNALQLYR